MSHEFPVLYGIEKSGSIRMWHAKVVENGDKTATATITYGQIDGKKQITIRECKAGKNIGRSNETTPFEQCRLETERKWLDKKEKEQYTTEMPSTEKEDEDEVIVATQGKHFPMLAATYKPSTAKRNDIIYPCLVQPKLDGLRCIMYMLDGKVMAQSRTGGYFESVGHLTRVLTPFFECYPDAILDGELYTRAVPFETLAGLIKKKKISAKDQEQLNHVCYHMYDMIPTTPMPFHERITWLNRTPSHVSLVPVETLRVTSVEEFQKQFSIYVEQGYEGIMLRNENGLYREGYRSNDLQKYKEFQEDEYPIVGYEQGDGRDAGCVIWVCENKEGKRFNVRPKGTMEQRREWFTNGKDHVGKMLTVIFQELSEQNIPRFPVGKAIRDGY